MKSLIKIGFVANILLSVTAILIIVCAFIENSVPFIIFGVFGLFISIILLKNSYRYLLIKGIKPNCWSKKLTDEEKKIVEEAKKEFDEYLQYETSYFEKYVQCLAKVRAAYQYKYYPQYFATLAVK